LLLDFIVKNNLSFYIVNQESWKALLYHLSPTTKPISPQTLTRDLQKRFKTEWETIQNIIIEHVEGGGRIALTIDTWLARNYIEYIAVTLHLTKKGSWEPLSILVDILQLDEPIHSGAYLCRKLVEVTNSYHYTHAIISVTRDNASVNDTMLEEFEAIVEEGWEDLIEEEQMVHPRNFQFMRKEGDVRCVSHVYNIAIQASKSYIILSFNAFN
jgi:hypothetical protein